MNANQTVGSTAQSTLALGEGQVAGGGYYNDNARNCTYGTGLLVHAGPCSAAELARQVNPASAQAEFQRRMNEAAERVRRQVTDRVLPQSQFEALTSAAYNARRIDNQAFLNSANNGDDATVTQQLGQLVHVHNHDAQGHAVGPAVRSQGLVNRRNSEIQQYNSR